MRRLAILFFISIPVLSSWPQLYDNYTENLKKELAEAYFLAGTQYKKLGFPQGERYIAKAYEIFPSFTPAQINESEYAKRLENHGAGFASDAMSEAEHKLVEYRFIRFMAALSVGKGEDIGSFLGDTIKVYDPGIGVTKKDAVERIESQVKDLRAAGFPATRLYDFKSVSISKAGSGDGYELGVRVDEAAAGSIAGFGEGEHRYGFGTAEDGFPVTVIRGFLSGQSGAVADTETAARVKDAFSRMLGAFFAKDVRAVKACLAGEIVVLPMATVLTNEEAGITFTGFFRDDALDTTGLSAGDVFDPDASLVRTTSVLSGKYSGRIMRLEPVLNPDGSDRMPFFAQYGKYYFASVNGEWVIIAVGV